MGRKGRVCGSAEEVVDISSGFSWVASVRLIVLGDSEGEERLGRNARLVVVGAFKDVVLYHVTTTICRRPS